MKCRPTQNSSLVSNCSSYGSELSATPNQLIYAYGLPVYDANDGKSKTNFEWHLINSHGHGFTIYDWKENRSLDMDEYVDWHIGADDKHSSKISESDVILDLSSTFAGIDDFEDEEEDEEYTGYF